MIMTTRVTITVNGRPYAGEIDPRITLVDFIRKHAGLTGTHVGCTYEGRCGACTVLLDGQAVKSCLVFAAQADGSEVRTVEGLASNGALNPVQEAFWRCHGLQCGFCTPGMLATACDLLSDAGSRELSDAEIREQISGNICRCTGYVHIVEAIQAASDKVRDLPQAERDGVLGISPLTAEGVHHD